MYEPSHNAGPKEFIALIAMLMSVNAISIDAMLPALSSIGVDLGASFSGQANQTQYVIIFIFIGLALGQLTNGPLADAFGRRRVLFSALALYLFGTFICIISQNIETMLFGRFIQGFGAAGPSVCAISIVRDRYSGRAMAQVMSIVMTVFIMAPIIAPTIGQVILFFASWRSIFGFYLVYALIAGMWAMFRLQETMPPERRIPLSFGTLRKEVKTIIAHPVTRSCTLAAGCVFGILISILSTVQQVYLEKYDVKDMFAVYFGLQAMSFGIASFVNSRLVIRLGMIYMSLSGATLIITTSVIFIGAIQITELPSWAYFIYGLFTLFSIGILFGNLNSLSMEPMGHIAGLASSIVSATSSILGAVFGGFIGQSYSGDLTPIFLGSLTLGLLAFGLIFYARTQRQPVA